jgi:hypothetical protein
MEVGTTFETYTASCPGPETISRAASRFFSTPVRTAATQLTSKTTGEQFKIRFNLTPVLDDRIKSWTAFCRADSSNREYDFWGVENQLSKKTSPGMTLLEFSLTWRRPIVPRPAGPLASAISLTARIRRAAVTKESERQFISVEAE